MKKRIITIISANLLHEYCNEDSNKTRRPTSLIRVRVRIRSSVQQSFIIQDKPCKYVNINDAKYK